MEVKERYGKWKAGKREAWCTSEEEIEKAKQEIEKSKKINPSTFK